MKKLKDNRGASFIFALIALVVATVVSVTILSASVTTVKRVSNDVTTQQTRLDLASAARLVRDEMRKTTMTEEQDSAKNILTDDAGNEKRTYSYSGDEEEGEHFDKFLEQIIEKGTASPYYTFYIRVPDGDDTYKEVKVLAVVRNANKDLVFTFELGNETVYLNMTAQTSATVVDAGTRTVTTSWQTAVITGITQTAGVTE